MSSSSSRLLLSFIFFLFLFTSCQKNEESSQVKHSTLNGYKGSDAHLIKLNHELHELNKTVHFSDSFPQNGLLDWDHIQVRISVADSSLEYIFAVRTGRATVTNVLITKLDASEKVRQVVTVNLKNTLRKATTFRERLQTAELFAFFNRESRGHSSVSDSPPYQNRVLPSNNRKKVNGNNSSSVVESCYIIFDGIIRLEYLNGFCSGPSQQDVANSAIAYLVSRLQYNLGIEFNEGFTVTHVPSQGIRVDGPRYIVENFGTYDMLNRSLTVLNDHNMRSGNAVGCSIESATMDNYQYHVNSCNATGGNPNDPVIDENGIEHVTVEEWAPDEDYSTEDLNNGASRVAIKYTYNAQITRDPDTFVIIGIVMDPIMAFPVVARFSDTYGRTVTRSITLFDKAAWYVLAPGNLHVNLFWSCLVHAKYVYSDGMLNTRQWAITKTRVR
ncbi:hypothetical protein GO493_28705 [Chitinophaga sp. ysch24]|uniref:Uncharacterized protein n=2 Tax=Chitinophaga tropicalis TaxID=2683588 RepID=A0A7K1UD23_9BACT|nr:hypothetical protein [Chitinophaga tropicalis]